MGCDPGDGNPVTIRAYADRVAGVYGWPVPAESQFPLDDDLGLAILLGAHKLKVDSRAPLQDEKGEPVLDALCNAWWIYNGRSPRHVPPGVPPDEGSKIVNRSWHYSPYVSNDPLAGVTLTMRATLPPLPGQTERRTINRPDDRPGCLAIWQDVLESFPV